MRKPFPLCYEKILLFFNKIIFKCIECQHNGELPAVFRQRYTTLLHNDDGQIFSDPHSEEKSRCRIQMSHIFCTNKQNMRYFLQQIGRVGIYAGIPQGIGLIAHGRTLVSFHNICKRIGNRFFRLFVKNSNFHSN